MITTSTVLVLGAGASAPYGFPTGPALKALMCQPDTGNALKKLSAELGYSDAHVDELLDRLQKGSAQSIDAFLEQNLHLLRAGKVAIARALIGFEDENNLLPPKSPQQDWYAFLFANMLSNGLGGLSNNKVVIATFNYDRSFEHRLALMISADYRLNISEAIEHVSKVNIIHCHGTLGSIHAGDSNFRPYNNEITATAVRTAADSIRIIHEKQGTSDVFTDVIEAMRCADRVYFFGFGYHPVNMRRLGITEKGKYPWSNDCKLYVNSNPYNQKNAKWIENQYGLPIEKISPYWHATVQEAVLTILDL